MPLPKRTSSVPADPTQWSEKSKHSVSFQFTTEYHDISYSCRRCNKSAVFTAQDQKYTFEVKKASIDQQRLLCEECWKERLVVERDIGACEEQWAESKSSLRGDREFLTRWLNLISAREQYVPYRPNTAAKNMLGKLIAESPNTSLERTREK